MGNLVLFMHTSVDAFVAGPSGEMDWIKVNEEIFDFAGARTHEAETALYGRKTYEMMESYWPTAAQQPGASKHDFEHSAWYNAVDKVVISKTLAGSKLPRTAIISEDLPGQITQLKQKSEKNILMFGSPGAAHSLMMDKLIDEFWLLENPIVVGNGIPLFGNLKDRMQLELIESTKFSCGVMCLHYVQKK